MLRIPALAGEYMRGGFDGFKAGRAQLGLGLADALHVSTCRKCRKELVDLFDCEEFLFVFEHAQCLGL